MQSTLLGRMSLACRLIKGHQLAPICTFSGHPYPLEPHGFEGFGSRPVNLTRLTFPF